ncbi:hypothetical protein ACIPYQ_40595 [Streptomyces sp. NPDC090045]|uniref:hypothetical protein n=1 Tax=Streptomyces sp. NPDC090045 TaxID=3365927 RepID=UPI003830C1D9
MTEDWTTIPARAGWLLGNQGAQTLGKPDSFHLIAHALQQSLEAGLPKGLLTELHLVRVSRLQLPQGGGRLVQARQFSLLTPVVPAA